MPRTVGNLSNHTPSVRCDTPGLGAEGAVLALVEVAAFVDMYMCMHMHVQCMHMYNRHMHVHVTFTSCRHVHLMSPAQLILNVLIIHTVALYLCESWRTAPP